MNVKQVISQSLCPIVLIKNPDTKAIKYKFSLGSNKELLSYKFALPIANISGSFSLTFFPETNFSIEKKIIFDGISKLDIVEIFEPSANEQEEYKKVFTGVVRFKKYVSQISNNSSNRRLSISGTAITGLVSQFYLNLDTKACAITKQHANNEEIRKDLTYNLLTEAGNEKTVSSVVKTIWKHFIALADQFGTPKISEYINTFLGDIDSFFDIDDDLKFHYPLGTVFDGQSTQDFFSVIDNILPPPLYEKFSYMSDDGNMKIKIRKVPFAPKDWDNLNKHKIEAKQVKSYELIETDNEVYTAFYAYLNGYPIQEDTALILSTMSNEKIDFTLIGNPDKYAIYGYRPLICHFIGYGKADGSEDSTTSENLKTLCENLKDWYGELDEMLTGNISLAMSLDKNPIMPGEILKFIGGEFYTEDILHSWSYGTGGEISLSVSRGGEYKSGKFSKLKDATDSWSLFEKGITKR